MRYLVRDETAQGDRVAGFIRKILIAAVLFCSIAVGHAAISVMRDMAAAETARQTAAEP
ncbi:hypothetical protein HKCCE2091_17360 [Rhodobacterales bacterium HKCCE2091]|nr:hypothetical protein [Rhodobacterales bacterium HKCCE2091]